MKIRTKLIIGFLACGLVPLLVVSIASFFSMKNGMTTLTDQARKDIQHKVTASLQAQESLKKDQIEKYFESIRDQVLTFSENRMVVDAMRDFKSSFKTYRKQLEVNDSRLQEMRQELSTYYTGDFSTEYANQNDGATPATGRFLAQLDDDSIALQHAYIRANSNPLGSKHLLDASEADSDYDRLHGVVHPVVRSFLEKFGYYDIFLIDPKTGDIVYSVFKELDYSTSLLDGPYAKTNFGEAFRKANALTSPDEFVLVDFKQYTPSYEAPASFIATPIFDGNEKIGIVIFQMPVDRILAVMNQREGLGETGETILVGADFQMRSDSYRDPEGRSLTNSFRKPETGKVESDAVRAAIHGESGTSQVVDYAGNETIQSYSPVNLLGLQWALVAKMDTAEAFAMGTAMKASEASAIGSVFWINTGVGLLASLGVLALAYYVANALVRPINSTVLAVEAAAEGDYSVRPQVQGTGELKQMNVAVERMLETLAENERKNTDYEGKISAISRSQAVIEFNLDGTIITANDNFLETVGYTLEEIVGQHHRIFCGSEYSNSSKYATFWSKLGRGEFEAGEFERLGKNGEKIWIQASYNPIIGANGKPFKVVKYAIDITERRVEAIKRAALETKIATFQESEVEKLSSVMADIANGDLTQNYVVAEA